MEGLRLSLHFKGWIVKNINNSKTTKFLVVFEFV